MKPADTTPPLSPAASQMEGSDAVHIARGKGDNHEGQEKENAT